MALEYQICLNASKAKFDLYRNLNEIAIEENGISAIDEMEMSELFPFEQRVDLRLDKFKEKDEGILLGTYTIYSIISNICQSTHYDLSVFINYDHEQIRRRNGVVSFGNNEEWTKKYIIEPYGFFKKT